MERFTSSLLGEAKTLLLATDGSRFSEGAIQEAIFFGQACQAKVIALHVVPVQAESIGAANFIVRQGREQLAPHLDHIRAMARDSGVELEVVVVGSSKPEKTIVEQARLRDANAILMGRHGKAGRLALLVGSMTGKVIAQGFPRVLVAPKDFIITGTHVLLALNDSPNSRQAAKEALSLGRTCTTLIKITVLAVTEQEKDRDAAQHLANAVCDQAVHEQVPVPCEPLVVVGKPADQIVGAARERQVDMILIGSRGRRRLSKMLGGQVTEQVIGRAHCAVLVVNAG
jgi:nucleotide-binding universal stress UspA family protein